MGPKAAARCWASTALLGIASLAALGCSSGDGVPFGGPFGGTVPADVMDAGGLGDGNGVLPLTTASSGPGASGSSSEAPTWTQLFNAYMTAGKVGNCAHSGCHQGFMSNPGAAFSWLQLEGQLGGPQPALSDPNSSCLTWLGGDMPPGGPGTDPIVQRDFDLWVKAGAQNN
jgi:hypothetical protein